MRTLIIPCAGNNRINGIPKWLLRHPDGNYLFKKCICGIELNDFDKIIITLLKDDDEKYNASSIIKMEFSEYEKVEILVLNQPTKGPAETVYKTIIEKNIEGKIVIKDSDVYIEIGSLKYDNFVAGLNLLEYDADLPNIRNKSFITVNEQNHILDIIEKQIKSDTICLGLYGIDDVNDFIEAYNALSDPYYQIHSLYLSHIIAYLIGMQKNVFNYIKILAYENWETEKDWSILNKKFGTYIIDLDNIFSINGYFDLGKSENGERYDDAFIAIDMLKQLKKNGAKLVLLTSRSEADCQKIIEIVNNNKLDPMNIIYNCSYNYKKIVSNLDDLKKVMLI